MIFSFIKYLTGIQTKNVILQAIFIFQCLQYQPLTYGGTYKYPKWADICGFMLSFSSMIWVPLYVIYYLISKPGSIKEVCKHHKILRGNLCNSLFFAELFQRPQASNKTQKDIDKR